MPMKKITKGYPNWDVPYNENVDEYNNTIGNETLKTVSQSLKGAINELSDKSDDITKLNSDISEIKTDIAKKVDKNNIVNNVSTTEEGYVLDARVGSDLNAKYNSIFCNDKKTESLSDAEYGVSFFDSAATDSPLNFWGTVYTTGKKDNTNYKQQFVLPWDIRISDQNIKYRTSDINGWADWYNIVLSKSAIKDVGVTNATFPNDQGQFNYYIKNGWCTVEFKDIAGNGTDIVLAESSVLPIPILQENGRLENNGNTVGTIMVSGNGKITCHKTSASLGYGTVKYQIDESKY